MTDSAEPFDVAPGPGDAGVSLHATCLVVGEAGILIRGRSGAGKSTLAREILDLTGAGTFARLVCDDRVIVRVHHGRIVASAIPAIAGWLEMRGLGLVRVPWEPKAVLRLVVDCDAEPERLPAGDQLVCEILGIRLARIDVAGSRHPASLVLRRLSDLCDTVMPDI